ncbi:hypothetical protein [Ruminococcus albus]|uniref:hypothetical protein n=1 Tax=Ruminococcus albus TaxID=1264 RepID=UPI0012B5CB9A|nr:hypothetical protein [Ruminococcus albus]
MTGARNLQGVIVTLMKSRRTFTADTTTAPAMCPTFRRKDGRTFTVSGGLMNRLRLSG